jgi:glycosyltransferase involved in cell wall biosynthesis
VDRPLVSVVIPVYNGVAYVARALDSVFAQTYPNLELIAVDDGSTDGSAEVLAEYGARLVVVRQENQGVAAARNAGMRRAAGRFIALLDQDDWWRPEKIARQVELLVSDERIGLVHTGVEHWDEATGSYTGPLDPDARPERLTGDCFRRLLLDNQVYNSSVVVRASVLEEVGLCDLQIRGNTVQDYDLWLRIARQTRFGFVPEPLLVFRVHAGQGTWDRRLMLSEEARLLERVIAAEGLARDRDVRRRMARLYDQFGTAQVDAGQRGPARRSFARSLRWRPSGRAALLWSVCLFPVPLIRALQAARGRSRAGPTKDPRRKAETA